MREKFVYCVSLIIVLCIGIIGTMSYYKLVPSNNTVIEKTIKDVTVTETDSLFSSIEKVYDSVVYIEATANRTISTGTGFIYKTDDNYGYIITNNHVVENADDVKITLVSEEEISAEVLGTDEYADIAVLRIVKEHVTSVASLGDSTKSMIGDTIFTVGSPLGIEYMNSVTKGILSGVDRTVTVKLASGAFLMNVLQIDASINPGNSGGPLCNINGEVIGVTSMKLVDSSVEGMGFAIPIEMVMTTVEQLEQGLKVERPYLGFEALSLDDTWQLYRNQIYLDSSIKNGVVVISIENASPFKKAGLIKGDVILQINDDKITSVAELRYILYKYSIGDTVKITYMRGTDTLETNMTLVKSINE